jgi:electron transfer flavoprotein alpha subunit
MSANVPMSANVMVLAEHTDGQVSDGTYELIDQARQLASALGGVTEVALLGRCDLAGQLGGADVVVCVEHPALEPYVPEAYERALLEVLVQRSPRLLLLSNATIALDLGAALSVHWDAPLVGYVSALEVDGGAVVATAQILGGKVLAEVELSGPRAIATVLGGVPSTSDLPPAPAPEVVHVPPPAGLGSLRMSLRQIVAADAGDVDISAADMLVSVGRGIESEENLDIVLELATALGAPLSASRPVVDAGWLPKTRQVGQSGLKVKPRAYLAFGISGAPEHLEGMRRSELIIACNTDPGAPIFGVAHYGTTIDLFDLVPQLVDKVRG